MARSRRHLPEPVLLPLGPLEPRGARHRVRDPRACARALARGDPRGSLHPEPPHPGAARPPARPARRSSAPSADDVGPLAAPRRRTIAELELRPDARSRARSPPRADRDVPGGDPVRLDDDDVVVQLPALISPATTSCSSCTSSQSSTPRSTGSMRSRTPDPSCSSGSQQTKPPARGRRCRAPARVRSFAHRRRRPAHPGSASRPAEPGSRRRRDGRRRPAAGVAWLSPARRRPSQKPAGAPASDSRRPRVDPGHGRAYGATWDSACQPQPMTPTCARPVARCLAATPLAPRSAADPACRLDHATSWRGRAAKRTTTNSASPAAA